MKKGFVSIILVIILFVAAVGGAYYLGKNSDMRFQSKLDQSPTFASPLPSPAPDETLKWKTFTNKKYKFSFRYPSNLTGSSYAYTGEKSAPGYVLMYFTENPKDDRDVLKAWVTDNKENLSLRDYAKDPIGDRSPNDPSRYTLEDKDFNGNQFLIIHSCPGCGIEGGEDYRYIVKTDKIFITFAANKYKDLSMRKDLLDKVSSSFQIII